MWLFQSLIADIPVAVGAEVIYKSSAVAVLLMLCAQHNVSSVVASVD